MLRIKEAILKYNEDKHPDEESMTQTKLAMIVFPNKNKENAIRQINKLANGRKDNCKISALRSMAKTLSVDYNFLIK